MVASAESLEKRIQLSVSAIVEIGNGYSILVAEPSRKTECDPRGYTMIASLTDLPQEIVTVIGTSDPQTWRSMRRVSRYWNHMLSWRAYVDKYTVIDTITTPTYTMQIWKLDGQPHREHDLPAVVYSGGMRLWHRRGVMHRDHGRPAGITYEGGILWCRHGCRSRDHNRPILIGFHGEREWYDSEKGLFTSWQRCTCKRKA